MSYVGLPPGSIAQFAGSVAPVGWLVCDGSLLSRSTYADLFAALGTTYGAGDGVSTFAIPDTRGRALYGQGSHADVGALGNNEGAALGSRRPKHKHVVNDPGHTHTSQLGTIQSSGPYGTGPGDSTPGGTRPDITASTTGITIGPQTGNEPTDTAPYLVVQHIIKY